MVYGNSRAPESSSLLLFLPPLLVDSIGFCTRAVSAGGGYVRYCSPHGSHRQSVRDAPRASPPLDLGRTIRRGAPVAEWQTRGFTYRHLRVPLRSPCPQGRVGSTPTRRILNASMVERQTRRVAN